MARGVVMSVLNGLQRVAERLLAAPLILVIWLYRLFISPLLGANCRHLPTCSEYALEALQRHGPLRGGIFALKRISRCHPWATPAFDPVPRADQDGAAGQGRRHG
jgi:putative membrane protein insertion efficiency factor